MDVVVNIAANHAGRGAEIAKLLLKRDFLSVEELAARFDVTTQTIRRDINGLCEQGAARRLHGGVAPANSSTNASFTARQTHNPEAKFAIASAVARLIPDGASVSFGIGTTPQIVADALSAHRGLKIVTNNLPIAISASQNPSFEVAIAGGVVRPNEIDVCGPQTEDFFSAYSVDFAIFGVGGVDRDGGLLDFSHAEVRAREAMRENCRASFLVLDSSKFDRTAHIKGGHIDRMTSVFCETGPPGPIERLLSRSGTRFVLCEV